MHNSVLPSNSGVPGAFVSSGHGTAIVTGSGSNGAAAASTAASSRFVADYTTRNLQKDLLEIAETYKSTIRNEVVNNSQHYYYNPC